MNLRRLVTRIRQSHALEHATVHLLADSDRTLRLVGRSDWGGFTLYGEVDKSRVQHAATQGMVRLKNDEGWLAVHPRCGTRVSVAIILATAATYAAAALPIRSPLKRLATVGLGLVAALTVARPLGLAVQRHAMVTTDLRGVGIGSVRRSAIGGLTVHRVALSSTPSAADGSEEHASEPRDIAHVSV